MDIPVVPVKHILAVDVALCFMVKAELCYGAFKSRQTEKNPM